MATVSARKLSEALSKARKIGLVEERFTIEDCEVTLRNLRPDEYAQVLQECKDLEDLEYLNSFQVGHLSRSIVEVNGFDLRDVDFVEVEEDDPRRPGQIRNVKLEIQEYLKQVLGTWSKEAIYTAYRKFGDVVELAEKKAKLGINFIVPEETAEDKYRRLLLEAKEVEENIPSTLVDKTLEEFGYLRKSTADEIKAAMAKTDQLAREAEASALAREAEAPTQVSAQEGFRAAAEAPQKPMEAALPTSVADTAPRQTLPVDPHRTLQQVIASRQVPQPVAADPAEVSAPVNRASKIAALEAAEGLDLPSTLPGPNGEPIPVVRMPNTEVVELARQEKLDPSAASQILDKPPVAGINPRFKPQSKL